MWLTNCRMMFRREFMIVFVCLLEDYWEDPRCCWRVRYELVFNPPSSIGIYIHICIYIYMLYTRVYIYIYLCDFMCILVYVFLGSYSHSFCSSPVSMKLPQTIPKRPNFKAWWIPKRFTHQVGPSHIIVSNGHRKMGDIVIMFRHYISII
jgi:hypothetical protein